MDIYAGTHIGNVRKDNEDSVFISGNSLPLLALVCDGMGGQAGGKTASESAAAYISSEIVPKLKKADETTLKSVALAASSRIFNVAKRDEAFKNMGTTLAAAIIGEDSVKMVNVGDSRIYLFNDEGLKQLTKDHKYVQYLMDKGFLTEEEALHHPYRNVITRALGMEEVTPDTYTIEWRTGDTLLICSDGLYEEVPKEDIEKILMMTCSAKKKSELLIAAALANGGRDNISAIVAVNDGVLGMLIKNRFEIQMLIAEGGMSRVYRAFDRKEKRFVAVKVLKPEYNDNKHMAEAFLKEGETTQHLNHKNIVRTIDCGSRHSLRYIIMEFIEGPTLADIMQKRRLQLDECVSIAQKLLAALSYAHHRGVIHKDLKPHNILMDQWGEPYLTDFGIAEELGEQEVKADTVMGSVNYFSPEQARGEKTGTATDIYSFGVMLYEMCTGKLPFVGENQLAVALMHLHTTPDPLTLHDGTIPESINRIVLKALEKQPERRYKSAGAMGRDIARSLTDTSGAYVRIIDDNSVQKKGRTAARLGSILAASLGIIAVLCIGLISMISQASESRTLIMPNLAGKFEEDALSSLNALGLELDIEVEYENSLESEDGKVLQQTPASGVALEKGDEITINIARYSEPLPVMPGLAGLSETEARQKLIEQGVSTNSIIYTQVNDTLYENGEVVSQYPEPGTELSKDVNVILYVNRLFIYERGQMPELYGLYVDDAIKGLNSYYSDNIFVYARYAYGTDSLSIYDQYPVSGAPFRSDAVIKLYINDMATANYEGNYDLPYTVFSKADKEGETLLTVAMDTQYDGVAARLVLFEEELSYEAMRSMRREQMEFTAYLTDAKQEKTVILRYFLNGEEVHTQEVTLTKITNGGDKQRTV